MPKSDELINHDFCLCPIKLSFFWPSSRASARLDLVFPRWKSGLFNLEREKKRISPLFVESPNFFLMGLQIFLCQGLVGLYNQQSPNITYITYITKSSVKQTTFFVPAIVNHIDKNPKLNKILYDQNVCLTLG